LSSKERPDEDIFAEELQKYQQLENQLQFTYQEQANLLGRVQQENMQFESLKKSTNLNATREQVLQQLNNAFKAFVELKGNLREGIQFYTNFQELLKQFDRKCTDFVLARQTEKQDLLLEIQKQTTQPNPNISHPPQQMQGMYQPTTQPFYGKQPMNPTPQYYQQPPPQYGQQPPPQYGQQPPPQYGQQPLPFRQQPPQFVQQPFGYMTQPPQYGQPQNKKP